MKVNVHISDLFFNSQHEYQPRTKSQKLLDRQQFREGFQSIHSEAGAFLASLVALHVANLPTTEELIEDFFDRL